MCCFNDEFQRSSCNPYHPFCIESHWPYISSLNVLRCSNVRPDRTMLSSNMPMGLWAMSEYERKPATLNGYSLYIYSFQVAIRIVSVSLLAAFRGSKNYQRIRFDGGSCKPHLFQGSSQAKPSKPDMKSVPNHFTWLDGTTCSHDCYMNANGFMPLQTVYCTCAPVQIDISLTVSVCI